MSSATGATASNAPGSPSWALLREHPCALGCSRSEGQPPDTWMHPPEQASAASWTFASHSADTVAWVVRPGRQDPD